MTEVQNPEWIMRRGYHGDPGEPRRFMSAQKLPSASPEAIDTMRKSQLTNKVKPFHIEFLSSVSKVEDKANTYRLANEVYTKKTQDEMGRRLSTSLSKSRSKRNVLPSDLKARKIMTLSKINSGLSSMALFDNLSSKTFQVPTYNQYILQLGEEKKELNVVIAELKVKITNEIKKRAKLNIQCAKHMNGIEKYNDLLNKNDIELKRIELLQTQCNAENNDLSSDIERTHQRTHDTQRCIEQEREQIAGLRVYIREKKHGIILADKLLNDVKTNLTKQLKIMGSCINEIRYLESQKSKVLLYIRDMTNGKVGDEDDKTNEKK